MLLFQVRWEVTELSDNGTEGGVEALCWLSASLLLHCPSALYIYGQEELARLWGSSCGGTRWASRVVGIQPSFAAVPFGLASFLLVKMES